MEKIIAVAIMFLFLLSPILAMSGDGGNVPVVPKKETISATTSDNVPVTQNDNTALSTKSYISETVKDRLSVDTGMSQKELDEFKTQYIKRAEDLGIQNYSNVSPQSYFDHKINLDAIKKIKELGLFLTKDPFLQEESFAYSVTHSDIIIVGTVDSVEYLYKTREEERNADIQILSRYFVKVDDILKGVEYYKSLPSEVSYFSSIGKYIISSGDHQLKIGQKYILFFQKLQTLPKEYDRDLCKIHTGTFRIEGTKIFRDISQKEYSKSYDDIITTIENFQRINDSANFYKRFYINKEVGNEK